MNIPPLPFSREGILLRFRTVQKRCNLRRLLRPHPQSFEVTRQTPSSPPAHPLDQSKQSHLLLQQLSFSPLYPQECHGPTFTPGETLKSIPNFRNNVPKQLPHWHSRNISSLSSLMNASSQKAPAQGPPHHCVLFSENGACS